MYLRLLFTNRVNCLMKCFTLKWILFHVLSVYQYSSSQRSRIENVKVSKFKALCFRVVNISFMVISTNDMLLIKILAALKW
jgi:hypothetical protein